MARTVYRGTPWMLSILDVFPICIVKFGCSLLVMNLERINAFFVASQFRQGVNFSILKILFVYGQIFNVLPDLVYRIIDE